MNKQLKVVLLVGGFPTKENPARCIFNYRAADLLARAGHDVHVLFIRIWKPGRPMMNTCRNGNFTLTTLFVPIVPGWDVFSLKLFVSIYPYHLGKILNNASILHSVSAHTIGVVGSRIARKYHIKHVAQLIGSDVNSMLPRSKDSYIIRNWEKYVDGISANSSDILKKFRLLYPDFKAKTIVNYRGVSLQNYQVSANSIDGVHILFLGGMPDYPDLPHGENTKGGQSLMDIWKVLDSGFTKETPVKLFFGGPGSDKSKVSDWRESLTYKEKVDILGNITPDKVREMMRMINLVIIPSKEEGTPNIAFEAMASGLPILGSNVGGIPELVIDQENGWILPCDQEQPWIEKLREIIQGKHHLKDMGQKSRARCEKEFVDTRFAEKLTALYHEILQVE